MTERERTQKRRALERLRDEMVVAGPSKIEPNRTDEATVGVADEDAQALSEMLQTLSSQRNRQRDLVLRQIARALRKIDETPDDYGLCEECEEVIAPTRLAALPHAALCAECQATHDPKRGVARRKVTDYR